MHLTTQFFFLLFLKVYNNHSLLHVVNEVKEYGPLYTFSAYKFENFMSVIKRMIKKKNKILQQLSKRLEEMSGANERQTVMGVQGAPRPFNSDLFPGCTNSFKAFQFNGFILKSNLADSCCMLDSGEAIQITRFCRNDNGDNIVIAKLFINARNFFTDPVPSSALGILLVDGVEEDEHVFLTSNIIYKFVRLPYNDFYILSPMLHNL